MAEDDGPDDPDGVQERPEVVGAGCVAPNVRIVPLRATESAQIQVDDLHAGGKRREVRLEVGMVVAARSAMHEDEGRALAHRRSVGDELRPLDIEEQACSVHADVHAPVDNRTHTSASTPR